MTGKMIYRARCVDGPLHRQEIESRFPKGFLAIEPKLHRVWIYDYVQTNDSAAFVCREDAGREVDDELRWQAANGGDYDVRAMP